MAHHHPAHRHQMATYTVNSALRLSPQGVAFIKSWEGYSATLYDNDGAGQCTIGWGHLVHQGLCNMGAVESPFKTGISAQTATGLLMSDLNSAVQAVRSSVAVKLSQSEFDALVSFTFNEGVGKFHTSTLLRALNAGNRGTATSQFMRWIYAARKISDGLKRRRAAEAAMFATGVYRNNNSKRSPHKNRKK